MRPIARLLSLCIAVCLAAPAMAQQYPWERLPPTPNLPKPERSGTASVNGIRLWYAVFGHGDPVVMVHGGLGNSDYWGLQVPVLAQRFQVIVLDSRGHGRSTRTDAPIGYDAMASDVLALMDTLHIQKAALVGWSDGAIIGLDIAIHHPERLTRLFAFAANVRPASGPFGAPSMTTRGPGTNALIASVMRATLHQRCDRKCSSVALNSAGSCRKAKWLTRGRISSPAPGMSDAIVSVFSRLIASS